ncbi:MAG: hypothetical protein H0Z40_11835 [Desulfotomaculum sp.]|nr:hypothetical protein [Desulfotomaculum sp.]
MPVLIEKDGQVTRHSVPVISGNAFRGIERRLLIDHSLDVLDINMEEIMQSKEEARRVLTRCIKT